MPATHPVHLIGGPLCGHTEPDVPEHSHSITWASVAFSTYTYCPHATAALSAQRGEYVTVFIHSSIEHDAFDPSLRDHLNS